MVSTCGHCGRLQISGQSRRTRCIRRRELRIMYTKVCSSQSEIEHPYTRTTTYLESVEV
jgi:hypothetical protein